MMCASTPSCRLMIGLILSTMFGVPLSMELRGMKPATNNHKGCNFAAEKFGDNVQVFGPPNSQPWGSLILLMGYGADLSWTMTQWWYLHPAWSPKDQKWCKGQCSFAEKDKAAALKLTSSLRIVDAVGSIILCKYSHAWYKYTRWPDGPPVADQLEGAVSNVFQLIEREYSIVGDYKKILIAGMSQGADLAIEVGMRFHSELAMVISQRGVLSAARLEGDQNLAARTGTPFILTAGTADELSSISVYQQTCVSLQLMKYPTYCKWYHGLNHGDFSNPEWELLMEAFALMLNPNPKAKQIDYITPWWDSWRLDEKYRVLAHHLPQNTTTAHGNMTTGNGPAGY